MIKEIQQLLDQYLAWLRDKTVLRAIDGGCVEVTTPYLDRHNDYIQIYILKDDGHYRLTDDGYTIDDLHLSGCKLDTPKRQELLRLALAGFGVERDKDALIVRASQTDFAQKKHNLVQAILAVNDLFYLAMPMVKSIFLEDIVQWFDERDIRFTQKVKFTGKSGYDHLFDFVIPKSRRSPERIVQTINRPSRDTAEVVAFKWIDTKDVRPTDSRAFVILNDQEREVPAAVIEALSNYDLQPIVWSQREEVAQELAA